MKPPVAKLLPVLQRVSREFIERFAAVELKPDLVRERIFEAAKLGHSELRLPIPLHLNVRQTEAGKALEVWCRENGLSLLWECKSGSTADGRPATNYEPEISWYSADK